jgi:hypothetical protein
MKFPLRSMFSKRRTILPDSRTKGKVALGMPADVETVGLRKVRRISVGGPDADMDVGALKHRYATQRRILRRSPVSDLVGAFQTQKFFDRSFDKLSVLPQISQGIRISDQKVNTVTYISVEKNNAESGCGRMVPAPRRKLRRVTFGGPSSPPCPL